jgi:hypothetical protein
MRFSRIFTILLLLPALVTLAQNGNEVAPTPIAGIQARQVPVGQVLLLDDVIREALLKNPEAQSALHTITRCNCVCRRSRLCPIRSPRWDGRAISLHSA